jgi:signal peptidase I
MVKLLPSLIRARGQADIVITGVSMEPTLREGDIVTVKQCENYMTGDILVYAYKDEGLLIHRLLKIDGRYFCKGDNAFRLEDIGYDEIIGKAVLANGRPIEPWADWQTALSYSVNREFFRCRYNKEETMKTNIYKIYSEIILKKEVTSMNYIKTEKMDFILSDETSLAVFDSESGNTYFLNLFHNFLL